MAVDPTGDTSSSNPSAPVVLSPGVDASSGDWFDNLANFAAGWGDSLSVGLTQRIRANTSIGGVSLNAGINTNSGLYGSGQAVGMTHSLVLGFVTPCGAGNMSRWLRVLNGVQAGGSVLSAGENASAGNWGAAFWDLFGALGNTFSIGQMCFGAGTPILTPGGSTAIEKLQPGEWVLSRPDKDPEAPVEARVVEQVFVRTSWLLDLHVGSQVIRTTGEHPFYARGRGWIQAAALKEGDELSGADGRWVPVHAVSPSEKRELVYNVRVAEYHTYFVGSSIWGFSVWAHNSGCLRNNLLAVLGESAGVGREAHHLIARTHSIMQPARDVLSRLGHDASKVVEEAWNGVLLPRTVSDAKAAGTLSHNETMTHSFMYFVNNLVVEAESGGYDEVVSVIEDLGRLMLEWGTHSKPT